jgi:hypothetical protein
MSNWRLGLALAMAVFLSGCPTNDDESRRARSELGAPEMEAKATEEFVCSNLRPWREDKDLPDYLKLGPTDPQAPEWAKASPLDDEKRGILRKEYIREHDGILTLCREQLVKEGPDRGYCDLCTKMLAEPKYQVQRPTAKEQSDGSNPVALEPGQELRSKIEYRLKWSKDDYYEKLEDQEKGFREWITKRLQGELKIVVPEPPSMLGRIETDQAKIIDYYVARESAKWIKDPALFKPVLKYELVTTPLAEPLVRCPTCERAIHQTESRCWNCNNFYTAIARDERNSIAEPLEMLCPACKAPVDPTSNFCANKSCDKFHRAVTGEGPCWRCGGTKVCPECGGSGKGGAPIQGGDDCYLCSGNKQVGLPVGLCPECDARGFATYEGILPVTYTARNRKKDDWRIPRAAGMPAGAGGGANRPAPPADNGGENKPEKE